jgi:starch synthase
MRYGTVPVVRRVGGLKDTVPDVGDEDGRGLQFQQYSAHDIAVALMRATHLYKDAGSLAALRQRIMALDFSWSRSAARYLSLYRELTDL